MQKTKTKIITALLLTALTLAIFPFSVYASTGFITINTTGASTPGVNVQAGANVSLYFGNVTFSGGQFTLYIGPQGFSQITTTGPNIDTQYTPVFDLSALQAATATQVPGTTAFPGAWTIGFGWINGTIKQDVAGGNFFIKAFDGTSTSVAVTDTYITIIANIFVTPTSGAAGQSIFVNGFAFPANALVNISYSSVSLGANKPLATLYPTGILGNFSLPVAAPDTLLQLAAGAQPIANENITFTVVENRTGATYSAAFMEFARGLVQVRVTGTGGAQQNAGAGNLFGNNTLFTLTGTNPIAGIGVNKVLRIAGNYFFQGNLVSKWDNIVIANTAPTINGTGWFNTTLTVPPSGNGLHNITLTDGNNTVFTLFITVVPSVTLNPTSGPVGTTVIATGYGFTAPSTGVVNNASISWPGITAYRGSAFVDSTGSFVITFTVPASLGGDNVLTAWENASGTFANITTVVFTVTASFTVTPNTFANNASLLVVASGTGFKAGSIYFPNIDNQMFGFGPLSGTTSPWQTGITPSSTGGISITFIGAGFAVGSHVVTLYENGTTAPAAYAGFNVTSDPVGSSALLTAINDTVTQTNSTVNMINNNLNLMNATIINIHDDVATVNTLLGKVDVNLTAIGAKVTAIQGTEATIQTTLGTIQTSLASINTVVTTINGNTATLSTTIGTLTTTVSSLSSSISSITSGIAQVQTSVGALSTPLANLDSKLSSVLADTATIKTSLGSITTSLSSISTTVTGISGNVATIQTSLGTLQGNITSISGNIATIQTNLGTLQADVSTIKTGVSGLQTSVGTVQSSIGSLQSDVTTVKSDVASNKTTSESLSPLIIVAIVLALIAAIAAIASIVLMRRKIAG